MSNKKIKPSINLTKYLDQTLRLERMKQKRLNLPSKLVRNNDEKKVRTLDNHIFRSVANLIYFFEFLNLYPDLINKFGEDIEDCLDSRVRWLEESQGRRISTDLLSHF